MSFTAIAFVCLAAPAFAAELKGGDAIAALNGKSFACKSGSLKFKVAFAKVKPDSKQIAFTFKSAKDTVKNAYILKKNGKVVTKDGASRRIFSGKSGSIQIKANGRPTAKCTPN